LAFARVGPLQKPQPGDDVQDLVFLGEARPVLIRLHVRLDGKTMDQAWDDYIKQLFTYLDVNGDGVLDSVEAERIPSFDQIQQGVLGVFAGRRRAPQAPRDRMEMRKGKSGKKAREAKKSEKDSSKQSDKPSATEKIKEEKKQPAPSPPTEAGKDEKKTPPAPPAPPPPTETGKDKKKTPALPTPPPPTEAGKDKKKAPTTPPAPPPPPQLTMLQELDTNKDGKVSLSELSAYYRKNGFNPFQVHLATPQVNPLAAIGIARDGGEPTAEQISNGVFALLDTNKDGKLTRQELAAAPALMYRLDENEDEMLSTRELVPNTGSSVSNLFSMVRGQKAPDPKEVRKSLIPLPRNGEVPGDLIKAMKDRYGPKGKKVEEVKLSCKELGLDEATFRQLDINGDGVLDDKEMAGFIRRSPDIELTVRLGEKDENQAHVETTAKGRPTSLASKLTVKEGVALLDLGVTRAEVRVSDEEVQMEFFVNIIRQQLSAVFKIADKGNKGYITKDDLKTGPAAQLANVFPMADRNNDGKLTEKELNDFLDKTIELQAKATASSVTLVLSFESRGLFDLLDTNGDGRLGVRELRGAVSLLDRFDRQKRGYLTKADIPRTAKLTARRGPTGSADPQLAAVSALYGGGNSAKTERAPTAGPLWFRKMDRNRDGDISRKEWMFSEELFRKIDTDGDGLISLEEALRYEASRKKE
jgi:Ca2+-binding EF-hand superfamily protein